MNSIFAKVEKLSGDFLNEMIQNRRFIHQNPELSTKEFETAKFVKKSLEEIGILDVKTLAETGVVAHIHGLKGGGDCVALRADLDALPILEKNSVSYCSENKGVMHACGHDAHTAALLGAAKILFQLRDEFSGTVKLIFQPSEEHYPGGAIRMINEGVLETPTPKAIFGLHCDPQIEVGKIGMKPGKYMASTDEIYLTVKGKGGHGALPEKCIDPIVISAHIITALQTIISRNASPNLPSVLTFGKIIGNGRTNIIPNEVKMEGIVRTFDESWRKTVHKKVENIAKATAQAMGGDCEVFIDSGYPFLYNDVDLTNKTSDFAKEFLGDENVLALDLRMTAEDFAYFAQKIPACYFRLGTWNGKNETASMLHSDTFDLDENSLKIAAQSMASFALWQLDNS